MLSPITPGSFPDDPDTRLVDERLASWRPSFVGLDPCNLWLLRQACATSIRVEHAEREESALRTRSVARARLCWDEDRSLAVEELAAGLSKRPNLVAERLKSTRHGSLWLARLWRALLDGLRDGTPWTDARRSLAHDLLGTPVDRRDGVTPLDPADPSEAHEARLAIADRELADLIRRADGPLLDLDRIERRCAEAGLPDVFDPSLKAIRRIIDTLHRRFAWCWARLKPDFKPAAEQTPAPRAVPADPVSTELDEALENFDVDDEATNLRIDAAMSAFLAQTSRPATPSPAPLHPNRHERRAAARRPALA